MPALAEAPVELTTEDVKQHIYRNSISNYTFLVVRVGLGAVLFRLIYQTLNAEDFGFWAVLWSMLGYGILLDFGFGFTAQKRVAELCVRRDWKRLSQVLSTIFYTYVGVALVIIISGYFGAPYVIDLLRISPENTERYTKILRAFLAGMGLGLPLGIFPEILRGQHRISLVNNVLLACYLGSFVGLLLAISHGWGLLSFFAISMGCSLLADLLCGFFAMKKMPQVVINPSLFSREMVRDTTRFSMYAYIGTVTTVILTRTDQLVLSTALAVAAVAIYQGGAKVSEMFSSFALQMADTLSPAAAHLHAAGDRHSLRQLLIKGTRFTVLLATPLYIGCAFFLDGILRVLTGSNLAGTEAYWVGQVLLLWTYMMVLTQSVTKRVFMMSGHEKRVTWLGFGEALMNLGLSIALVLIFRSVVSVAIASLIATSVFGWGFLWPWAAKEAGIKSGDLAKAVLFPAWLACVPLIVLVGAIRFLPRLAYRDSTATFLIEGSIAAVVALVGLWKLALDDKERAKISGLLPRWIVRRSLA
jgi:O-antigen/teichoic acid export membrane protein